MIVLVSRNAAAELKEAGDFKRFHLEVAAPREDRPAIAKRLARLVAFDDDTSAWVSVAGLRQLHGAGRDDEWNAALAKMIAAARPHGWIRDQPEPAIKAHVVWAAASGAG